MPRLRGTDGILITLNWKLGMPMASNASIQHSSVLKSDPFFLSGPSLPLYSWQLNLSKLFAHSHIILLCKSQHQQCPFSYPNPQILSIFLGSPQVLSLPGSFSCACLSQSLSCKQSLLLWSFHRTLSIFLLWYVLFIMLPWTITVVAFEEKTYWKKVPCNGRKSRIKTKKQYSWPF